ncbi:MAG: GNAT family N-acetyltransferase [Lautropia sp.]
MSDEAKTRFLDHMADVLNANVGNRITVQLGNGLMAELRGLLAQHFPDAEKRQVHVVQQPEPLTRINPQVPVRSLGDGIVACVMTLDDAICYGLKRVHELHWQETEGYRNAVPLNVDYDLMRRSELAGRFAVFAMLEMKTGQIVRVVGNFMCYFTESTHTGELVATEDSLFVMEEFRRNNLANHFIEYVHDVLRDHGIKEIRVTTKAVNKVGELLRRRFGYEHVGTLLVKRFEPAQRAAA